uniref:PH domain-containing protein n=1 Tax=Loa loa TaxID=7209 RepID=A0A1I7VPV9_LOALO
MSIFKIIDGQGLHNKAYRASDNCLDAVDGEVSVNSLFASRCRSLSLSAQNCNRASIFTTTEDMNTAIDIGKVASLSENDLLTSCTRLSSKCSHDNQTEILLTVLEHQKIPLGESHDCISLTDRSSNLTLSPAHSNKSLNDSIPWGDVTPSVKPHIPTSKNSDVAKERTLKDAPLPYMMLPDTDHTSGCDFNRTQITSEEYVKGKTNVAQKTKELSKGELKKHSFVTQHTIIYPRSHLEMQCFPNSTCHFKYEGESEDKQAVTLRKDQYSQTKEPVVTQSREDTNRAVSVLNIMLQRRLNNSGSQNGSFIQERLNTYYSTPSAGLKSTQRISNFQSFTRTNELNDLIDKSDTPLRHSKYLSVEPEMDKKAIVGANQQCVSVDQQLKENLNEYCRGNSYKKTTQKSVSDGRSTIRDHLPRGKTRKLASLFETMSDAASVEMLREMDHLKRRGKSVPPNIVNKTYHRETEVNMKGLFRDDLILQQRSTLATNSGSYGTHLDLTIPCKRNGFERLARDKCVVETRSVRSIVNRFESASDSSRCQNSARAFQTDTPRKPKNQKRYSQYVTSTLQSVPGITSYSSIQDVQYAVDSNYNVCSIGRSLSRQSNEWNGSSGRASPSHNLLYDSTSCANIWDQQQYELGLRKMLSRDSSYAMQTQVRQMNYSPEVKPSYHMDVVTDRSQKHTCGERLDNEVEDHVAEVEKAFAFVNKTQSLATPGQQCSQESLGKPSSPAKASYSISLYRDLEREHHKSRNGDIPVCFSPAIYSSPPSAGELLTTYEHKNSVMKNAKLGGQMVTTDPMATSTPLNGSPAGNSRLHTSASYALNRSGISSITASTAHEIVQLQQSDIELQTVKQEIMIQEGQIAQASLALTHCKKNSSFNGTLVELSAQRSLLLARERLLALRNEMQRLKTRRLVKEPVPPLAKRMRGAIDLTSINVYLNRNFCVRNIDEDVSYAFVILLKTDEQVEATQTVTLMDTRALRVSKVHFSDQIRFTNLPVDFTVLLEIYALKVSENRRSDDYSCSMLKNKAKSLLSPSKKTCGNESVVDFSEFTCCGHICLNRDTIGMQKFYLDGAVYPLEGTVEIDSRCTTLPPTIEIDFRGFLTMYQIIAGLGSWARYWAVLRCGVVQFWKYPDDEASEKPALACMDLSKCTDKEISHAPHEICSRPNAFTVDLLVSTSPSLIEKKRVLLSADTKELCSAWLNALNGTLEVLRG